MKYRHFWKFLHLWELFLGLSVPLDVEKLWDSIALMTLCFGFLVFSSSLHSILTTVELFSDYKDVIRTKDRSQKWIFNPTNLKFAYDIKGLNTTILLMKRTTNCTGIEDCLNDIFNNKAVSCEVDSVSARQLVLMDFKNLETNSPFVFKLERHK